MRAAAIAMVLLVLAAGSTAAVALVVPAVPEQAIEGHTVWAVVEVIADRTKEERFAAAVAVLVKEVKYDRRTTRFPGVLWFNDQYLDLPEQSVTQRAFIRHPCTGVAIAVNRGDLVDQDDEGRWTLLNATYANESYLITDPNERVWIVDVWNTTWGHRAWTSALRNNQAGGGTPDDGRCDASPYSDSGCVHVTVAGREQCPRVQQSSWHHKQTGDHGMRYPCPGCSGLQYNALLYFRLEHLTVPDEPKDHRERVGQDWWDDAAGCHRANATGGWPCPGDDDDREGNSHPYNPERAWPLARYDGRDNHGGSDDCFDGPEPDLWCHATRNIDLYYGYMRPPATRIYWLEDTTGADAPFHCHAGMACGPEDYGL